MNTAFSGGIRSTFIIPGIVSGSLPCLCENVPAVALIWLQAEAEPGVQMGALCRLPSFVCEMLSAGLAHDPGA